MGRKILFVTTDQQRYDTLGCNGGQVARTPVVDALAAQGIRYERAVPQSVVCMPSRSTMLTGQYPSTHGVWMNGVPLPVDAPSVAAELHRHGYRTALVGKAHFEPFMDPFGRFTENSVARSGEETLPNRVGRRHRRSAPRLRPPRVRDARRGRDAALRPVDRRQPSRGDRDVLFGDRRRLQRQRDRRRRHRRAAGEGQPDPARLVPHRLGRRSHDRVARRAGGRRRLVLLDELPRPAPPVGPARVGDGPRRLARRPAARRLSRPTRPSASAILDAKPRHWRQWYDGTLVSNYEAPKHWVPATLTEDQIREINARNAVECELIDEALGRVLAAIDARGWTDDVDVIFTTDHGELQGDFGLLFKGPYHVDGLMRLPLVWRPAPSAGVAPAVVTAPVGLVDLAPTFCAIAGRRAAPTWMQGQALPVDDADADARGFERVLTEWDSELFGVGVHLRTITRDGWVCTAYKPGYVHDGTEGELVLPHRRSAPAASTAGTTPRRASTACRPRRRPLGHQPADHDPRLDVEAPV